MRKKTTEKRLGSRKVPRPSPTNGLVLRFDEPEGHRAIVVEDDARVAYAYLLLDEQIVADVWLYNVGEAPPEITWINPSNAPFQNPRGYCSIDAGLRITERSAVGCHWVCGGVAISVDGVLLAFLEGGAKPGWSRLVLRTGPLARPLDESPYVGQLEDAVRNSRIRHRR